MSTYEKIASAIMAILLVFIVASSYHEYKEPVGQEKMQRIPSSFEQSFGQDFIIGNFTTIVNEQSSGGLEDGCERLQPVIVAALHDIKEHLEHQKAYTGVEDPFEVNERALQLLCNKNVEITLADSDGNTLVLKKIPFTKAIPPQSTPADSGTEVRIDATLVHKGVSMPTQPTTYGDVLIPDRFLDTATTS